MRTLATVAVVMMFGVSALAARAPKMVKEMPVLPAPALQCSNHDDEATPPQGNFEVSITGKSAILHIIHQKDAESSPEIDTARLKCKKNTKPTPCCDQMGLTYSCTGNHREKDGQHEYHVDVHSGGFFFHHSVNIFKDDQAVATIPICE